MGFSKLPSQHRINQKHHSSQPRHQLSRMGLPICNKTEMQLSGIFFLKYEYETCSPTLQHLHVALDIQLALLGWF